MKPALALEFCSTASTKCSLTRLRRPLCNRFREAVRSFEQNGLLITGPTQVAQVNEILAKLICHNLTVVVHEMFENGIAPSFVNQNSAA